MSDSEGVKKEKEDSIEDVKKYTSKLIRIKGSSEYYSWFNERLTTINGLLSIYPVFVEDFNKLMKTELSEIPEYFTRLILEIFNYFSRFYHVKTIYDSSETGILSSYFVNSLQFNVMIRFFNFINTDPTKFLIPPPYDLQFDQTEYGSFVEDRTYSGIIPQITNDILAKQEYQMVFLTIKLYYYESFNHQNLLFFNKNTREIYLIEPSLEMDLKPQETQGKDIDAFLPVIAEYTRVKFPGYIFRGFFRPHACGFPYHGGICAPLSIMLVLRPDIQNYNGLIALIKFFADNVLREISEFHTLLNYGIQNPSNIARYPAPSTFTQDFPAYNMDDDESDDEYESDSESNSFGKNKSEIKYLKKLIAWVWRI
jgi:hypothetical protein